MSAGDQIIHANLTENFFEAFSGANRYKTVGLLLFRYFGIGSFHLIVGKQTLGVLQAHIIDLNVL